jgi:hypothetical protein
MWRLPPQCGDGGYASRCLVRRGNLRRPGCSRRCRTSRCSSRSSGRRAACSQWVLSPAEPAAPAGRRACSLLAVDEHRALNAAALPAGSRGQRAPSRSAGHRAASARGPPARRAQRGGQNLSTTCDPGCWRTKICDTPRARENDAQPPIVTMFCCPGTSTCRMHPVQYHN